MRLSFPLVAPGRLSDLRRTSVTASHHMYIVDEHSASVPSICVAQDELMGLSTNT